LSSIFLSRSHAQQAKPNVPAPPKIAPIQKGIQVNPSAQAPVNTPPPPPQAAPPSEIPQQPSNQPVQQTAEAPNPDLDVVGIRDPFKPYRQFKPEPKAGTKAGLPSYDGSDPLQNVELSAVEVVAVLWDVQEPKALVRTAGGNLYTLKRNTKIGRNNGYVMGIREGEVVIVENYEEDGKIVKQYTSLKMASAAAKKAAAGGYQ
jgi:Tfp pilus assembly protein PilP